MNPVPRRPCSVMPSSPSASSCRARSRAPTSIGIMPPPRTRSATLLFAPSSSPAMRTSSGIPATSPATSVPAKVVLKALTSFALLGSTARIVSAAEVDGDVTRASYVAFSGFEMSTTTLSSSALRSSRAISSVPSYGVARITTWLSRTASAAPAATATLVPGTAPCSCTASVRAASGDWSKSVTSLPPAMSRVAMPRPMLPVPMMRTCMRGTPVEGMVERGAGRDDQAALRSGRDSRDPPFGRRATSTSAA